MTLSRSLVCTCPLLALAIPAAALAQTATNPANCHTYMLTPTASTWTAAEAYAVSLGGHLCTIRGAAEQAWINSTFLVGPDATHAFWIGLHNAGGFVWTSGEAPVYSNWHGGEPNNACGGEPAVAMNWYISENQAGNPGDWNDTNNGGVHYNFCGSAGSVPYRGIVEIASSVIFTTQPASGSVCPNAGAPLSVAVSGGGPFTYRWQIEADPGVWATMGNDPLPLPCGGSAHASPFDGSSTTIGISPCPGVATYNVRCMVTSPCGSAVSNAATLTLINCTCTPDFNNDGDVGTDADIEAFFACLAGNCCPTCGSADFNGDGDVGTDADIEAFFRVLAGGSC